MRCLTILSILCNCEVFFSGSMHFRLAPNPFGNTFGLFCSSRVQPALLGNVSPTLCLPRGASGQSRAALLTIFASERLSGMRTSAAHPAVPDPLLVNEGQPHLHAMYASLLPFPVSVVCKGRSLEQLSLWFHIPAQDRSILIRRERYALSPPV